MKTLRHVIPMLVALMLPAVSAHAYYFTVLTFGAPESVVQGQNLAGGLSLAFHNTGPEETADLTLELWLTADLSLAGIGSLDGMHPGLHKVGHRNIGSMPTGATYIADFATWDPPPSVPLLNPTGSLYLVARASHLISGMRLTDVIAMRPITVGEAGKSVVYSEDFQYGPAGWSPINLADHPIYIGHSTYSDGGVERGVLLCGNEDSSRGAMGYGNNWDQRVAKDFTLPTDGPVAMTWLMQFQTEPERDLILLEVSRDGGVNFDLLGTYSGSSEGAFLPLEASLHSYIGETVTIRFRFVSDAQYSDEDYLFSSGGGAFRLDSVAVGLEDTFESGMDGWVASTGPFRNVSFRLEPSPVCYTGLTCNVRDDGSPIVTCNGWVAYDPLTEEFPDDQDGLRVDIGILSPPIAIPAVASAYYLVFDVSGDLPESNGIAYKWAVNPGGAWRSDHRYATQTGWGRRIVDITPYLPLGTTSIRVRLAATDIGYRSGIDPTSHTAAPFFDNVQVIAVGTAAPGVSGEPRACVGATSDQDGDGVPDLIDACPTESAAWFDRDGDGCLDPVIGARHIEYWSDDHLPLRYRVHQGGAPGITDGSDLTAIQAGFASWAAIPGGEATVQYEGTTPQADAQALDLVNLITFSDPDFVFPHDVLAVGLSTSFTEPLWQEGGGVYRPGQIVDCDMIFNPAFTFATATQGSGIDLQSIVAHEAGHMLGLSHSAVVTSTMFYVLPPQTSGATLALEDQLAMLKAYPSAATLAETSHLRGTILDGRHGTPVGGVAVFAIGAATGDTLACEYSLPADGSFHFIGLPGGEYWVAIHPLNGTSRIGYLQPGNINHLIAGNAITAVVPEWWDAAESSSDDPEARTPVMVGSGTTTNVDFVTNIDSTGPIIVAVSPARGAVDVPIDAAILVRFDETIDIASLQGNFLLSTSPSGSLVPGNAAMVEDGRTLAYVPAASLAFATTYYVIVRAGVKDIFENPLAAPDTLLFTTQARPPISLASLSPRKGPAGSVAVLTGMGFGHVPADNTVNFGAGTAQVLSASPGQIVITVPASATAGNALVTVTRAAGLEGVPETSNALTFTVLPPEEVARGQEIATVALGALPRAVAVAPDGARVFVATAAGLSIIDVGNPTSPVHTALAVTGGLNALDLAPGGGTLQAVSSAAGTLCRFQVDPPLLLSETPLGAEPRGLRLDPSGGRAFVPTDTGIIQVWDVGAGSATYGTMIGTLIAPDLNLTGRLVLDPAGNRLLALSGSGQVLVYDLTQNLQVGTVQVLSQPRDLVLDPAGQIIYVTDATGFVGLALPGGSGNFLDIPTGGAPRGLAITPSGSFAYVADYQLDYLDVIDLRAGSPTYRQVAARIPQRADPLALAFSPDGNYVYTLVEAERMLVICAAGAGPVLSSVTPQAAPVGAKVVLAGSGFETGVRVLFGNLQAPIERGSADVLVVTVPAGATSGPLTVLGATPGEVSNSVGFQVLGPTPAGGFRRQAATSPSGAPALSGALAVAPDGDLVALGTEEGVVHLLDTDPAGNSYYQFKAQAAVAAGAIADLDFSPDGKLVYAVAATSGDLSLIDADPGSAGFGAMSRTIALGAETPSSLAAGPDGRIVAVGDPGTGTVRLVDLATDEVRPVMLGDAPTGLNGRAGELAFHPGGALLYVTITDDDPSVVLVLNADPNSSAFATVVGSVTMPGDPPAQFPASLSFSPDGSRCWVMTRRTTSPPRSIVILDTASPLTPTVLATAAIGTTAMPMAEMIRVAPAGDRGVLGVREMGLRRLALPALDPIDGLALGIDWEPFRFAFDRDGSRLFVAATLTDSLYACDFGADRQLAAVWGHSQTGVTAQPLPSPLRVRVTDLAGGGGVAGVPVTFRVTSGGGHFVTGVPGALPAELIVGTDPYGYAQASWVMGTAAGVQTAEARAEGASGSPIVYSATAVNDPQAQPLSLVESLLAPPDGAAGISVTTAVQAVFSRAVDTNSLLPTDFFLSADGGATAVPTVLGLADGDRRLSLTPIGQLQYGATYTVVIGAGIRDSGGGSLQNPRSTTFGTAAPPAGPVLTAVSPPSAAATVGVILSGSGFSPTPNLNTVWFNDLQATVTDAGVAWARATVPLGATSGTVRIQTGGQSSGTLPFTVLVPSTTPPDEVIATVATGSSTRSVTVSPDGAVLYAVSPEADVVVAVLLSTLTTLPGIPVGDQPWALAVHPTGDHLYVANRLSGDVSIIGTRQVPPDWHQTVGSLQVGAFPVDIAVSPAGDRVLVANSGSQDLSVIDSDANSASYHRVIATVPTGSSARTVTVSPDGGRIYVGTDNGYAVIDPLHYGVLRTIDTGSAAKSVTVSPDGALLVLVDTQGKVWIYDVAEGSARQDQVIASAPTGSAAKTATVSPDGALLYVLLEEGNSILVFTLYTGASIGAVAPGSGPPPAILLLVATLTAGANPADIVFDPVNPGTFYVTNAGDNTISVFGAAVTTEAQIAGRVYADCPAAGTALVGVEVDIFHAGTGELVHGLVTDGLGRYEAAVAAGDYMVMLVTPLGYLTSVEERRVTLADGDSLGINWPLRCTTIVPSQRTMSFWKHQVGVAVRGEGSYEIDGATLCGYLDLIEAHFNSNLLNPVEVYVPPASNQCADKLLSAKDLLNLDGDLDVLAHAKQELMALLLNVAAQKLGLSTVISVDGATVSRAITYVDRLIDDGDPGNDELALRIAKDINKGKLIGRGVIPSGLPEIAYAPRRFSLGPNRPNPFNPATTIAFEIAARGRVQLRIYDVAGRLVRTLIDEDRQPGAYAAVWNGRDDEDRAVASGVYFYQLGTSEHVQTRKMMLVK